jgi:hypothetical protein
VEQIKEKKRKKKRRRKKGESIEKKMSMYDVKIK